jgi:uncharacterized protein YecE (DUF72 family)
MNKVLIGTSGFNYRDWRSKFYPEDLPQREWLHYFSEHFTTVEINNSFYVGVRKTTYEKWYSETPSDFAFVIKGHRLITQLKKLHDVGEPVEQFFEAASGLRNKLSCVLWQFPASFKIVPQKREEYLKRLEDFFKLLPSNIRHALEFRDISWFEDDVAEIMKKYNAAYVFADTPKFPCKEIITSDFIYIRFHGPSALYASSYSDKELQAWAAKINTWKQSYDCYAYFNNDMSGYAIENARTLQDFIGQKY